MENPADIFTTGTPMSEKGNFDHNKYGSVAGNTVIDVSALNLDDHDYPNNSDVILRNSTCDNVGFINNSIQNGFQSEILCSYECDTGMQSDLQMGENSSLEIESVSDSDTHINFSTSPSTSFEKIESFSSVEGLVPSLDDQLNNYLLSEFKSENKCPSEDGNQEIEDEQRNVNEAICDIAKSFGFEDLLPDTFQADNSKDGFCVTVTTDDFYGEDADDISGLSVRDFEKCPDLHSSESLNLVEDLSEDNYITNGLDAIVPLKSFDISNISSKYLPNKIFVSSKEMSSDVDTPLENNELVCESEENLKENKVVEFNDGNANYLTDNICDNADDLVSDIPTVSISDVQVDNSLSDINQSCPPAGTVLVTTDKASKKMQIVLTLEQGQQIYDIDTESVDTNHQPIDLDLPTSFGDKLQEIPQNSLQESDIIAIEEVEASAATHIFIEHEQTDQENKDTTEQPVLVDLKCVTAPKGKVKKTKTWICPIEDCGQVLDKECKLRVHMISHKGARPFKCPLKGCDWAFTTPYRLRRHEETHLGSKDYTCDFEGCNRKFTTVYNLKTHKKRHKWPNSLTCPSKDCKMSFANRRKLELHLRVHNDVEAPYKCTVCGKQYYSANCIASHYRTHQYNEDDFKCPFQGCGKVYDKICRLRQHIRHHTGDRPYTCPAEGCKWSFMSASKLTRHMRKHTGERKFVCTEPGCGKSFMRPEHLKGHIVIHSGDKPFHCPHENCNARFTAKSSLYVHVKKHCPSVLKVVYPCPIESCVKKYNSKATLKQHLQKLHPDILEKYYQQYGKPINIAEKLELTMPVVVNPSENSLELMDIDEFIADDPSSSFQVQLLQVPEQSLNISLNSGPVVVASVDKPQKTVSKPAKSSNVQSAKESTKSQKSKDMSKSTKLTHINSGGCARTDYCCNYMSKKAESQPNYLYLNNNSNDNLNLISTDIKSPDVMLTSSIIYDNLSEQLIKNHFSPDNSSISNSLYHDDSILVSSSTFGQELIPVSLLSDGVDSDESMLHNHSPGIVFSEQNGVDSFSDSIHLHGLD